MLLALWLGMICGSSHVAVDLAKAYCQAALAWWPYQADITAVRWCEPGECEGVGGAQFLFKTREIAVDPDWPFEQYGENALVLTLEHEYGHALGLKHREGNSIMRPGWALPFVQGPTLEDFNDLRSQISSG